MRAKPAQRLVTIVKGISATRHKAIGMSVGDAVEVCEHLQLLLPLVGIQGSCQRNAKLFLQLCWSESKKHTSGSLLQCEVLKMRRIPR